jgi:peptide/nickel transport system ATP-binding protein
METELNNHQFSEPLLRVVGLEKTYSKKGIWSGKNSHFNALEGVALTLLPGSCTALVGESGSGKSTLVACLARLEAMDHGEIWFEGVNFSSMSGRNLRLARRRIQVIFQDASAALNPRFSALELVQEPLIIQKIGSKSEQLARASEILQKLGIDEARHQCRPHEFSGGQRKRIALARAIVIRPRLLILDEVFSGLDLLVAGQILKQLMELRAQQELTLLFSSHDLRFLARSVDSVIVMYQGRIVEQGSASDVFHRPQHPYTKSLMAADDYFQNAKATGASR